MSDNKTYKEQEVKTAHLYGLTLFLDIDKDDGTTDRANMAWSMRNLYPRLTVYTSKYIKDAKGVTDYNKMIIAPFDMISLLTFIGKMKEVMTNKEKRVLSVKVNCLYPKYVNNQKTNDVETKAVVEFGRNSEGLYYFKTSANGRPTIEFVLLTSKWVLQHNQDDTPVVSKIARSRDAAKSYIQLLESGVKSFVAGEFTKYTKTNPNAPKTNTTTKEMSVDDINSKLF